MKRTHLLPALAVMGALILGTTACGGSGTAAASHPTETFPAGSTMAKIQQRGKVIVGVKFDQPLFGVKNPITGQMEGLDIEMAKILAKDLTGSENNVQYVEAVTKNREAFLEQNKVDVVIASYAVTDQRKKAVDFAGPYLESDVALMVRKDDTSINKPTDLSGKSVCSTTGARASQLIATAVPSAKLVLFSTYSECAQALKDKRVDAVTTTEAILLGIESQNPGLYRIASGHLADSEEFAIGSPKNDPAFHTYLDGLLKKAVADGDWQKAYEATIGKVKPEKVTPPKIVL
ncbi:glutamate ABC transporter substrate-binding protein [Arthrobacter sp. STN4]|uniref:glutamate ABC transporter substrate-binding protein n=1 Tax=Arthrobacter sp. STN4 TaxID=2923276 RepID=UPI002119E27F|nr:glutamate ABC transporter substrate-binding protein [Arthrobacter sp. STN4]MCQ9164485.1 glutamate ABC transporter substrate-binding protein [Arthrobacter sp. STN4]